MPKVLKVDRIALVISVFYVQADPFVWVIDIDYADGGYNFFGGDAGQGASSRVEREDLLEMSRDGNQLVFRFARDGGGNHLDQGYGIPMPDDTS
jgi:hypothetical protein